MAIDPKLDKLIEQEMTALIKERLLRPGMSYNDFTGEYTNIIGQSKEDKIPLTNAGLTWNFMRKYEAYLAKLAIEHGERVASEGVVAEVEEQFGELMPQAKAARKIIMVVLRYILARTDDSKIKRAYKMIRKGYGNIDTLHDIIAGISVINKNLKFLSQVRPGGKEVTQKFLEESKALALQLIELKGDVTAAADDGSFHVDRQNRLITLCIQAQQEIKLFAEIAFYDDQEHYDRYYASDRLREIRDKSERNREETQTEEELLTQEVS